MKKLRGRWDGIEVDGFSLVSLFLKGFLRKEKIDQNLRLKRLLEGLSRVRESDQDSWTDFTCRIFLAEAVPSLSATLERPLTESERLYLGFCVQQFIEAHGAKGRGCGEKHKNNEEGE